VRALEKIVPAYGWLRDYKRVDLSSDLSAALTVTVMLVPQGMAYALLAGLPPIYGLYASTVPAILYALFGTSRHMPVGPPALMALLTFTSVSALAEPGSGQYISLALLLAFMVGALQLTIGLLRMGFVTNFIPRPVLSGFIYASAIVIALSQMKYLLGIPLSAGGSTVSTVLELARGIGGTEPLALAIGLGSIVGEVPRGLPTLSVPALDPGSFRALLPAAVVVAFVGFIESISVAKAVAAKERYKIASNQELKALGLANLGAAFFSGFPVAGSFSRTAVQYQSGAKTQLASIITALLILATLLFLTPLFYYLPAAALAAIIMVAVYRLLDFEEARRVFKIRRADGVALLLTFALTLLVGVEEGIIGGAAFALILFVRRTAYPNISELGYVEEEDAFLGLKSYSEAKTYRGALIIRFDASFYYANVPYLEEWLIKEVADRPDLKHIVIDGRGVNSIDVTAIEDLEDLISGYRNRGIGVLFTHMKLSIRERLKKAGWEEKFGGINYPTTRDAIRDVGLLEDRKPRDSGIRR
jgi:SulP family sulfate permease